MRTSEQAGFTIIETMLFLAVSGFLIITLMAGTGMALAIQRYRDSVVTLQTYIQDQYAEVLNVRNERDGSQSCNNAVISDTPGSRGQSSCVVIGRYVGIVDDTISSSSVVGYGTPNPDSSDFEALQQYNLSIFDSSTDTRNLEWGARVAWPRAGGGSRSPTTPRSLAMLIVRSPLSGVVYTFTANEFGDTLSPDASELRSMIRLTPQPPNLLGRAERRLCIDAGGFMPGSPMGVVIKERASNANAIETRTNELELTLGGDTQC